MSVQAQWSLDRSSTTLFGFARGALQAATTDNVQSSAIRACEYFGSTLAICLETSALVEKAVVPHPESAVVNFLKANVGYGRDQCVSQLGASLAGVKFLALAATLVIGPSSTGAANAIQAMMEAAVDQVMVPTVRQLQEVLDNIKARCLKTAFIDSVSGWQRLLSQSSHAYCQPMSPNAENGPPSREVLVKLVDAFRQLRRVNDSSEISITINTTVRNATWTIAFTKWCLGIPPSILFDDGIPVIQQEGADVTLVISNTDKQLESFSVNIHCGATTYSPRSWSLSNPVPPTQLLDTTLGSCRNEPISVLQQISRPGKAFEIIYKGAHVFFNDFSSSWDFKFCVAYRPLATSASPTLSGFIRLKGQERNAEPFFLGYVFMEMLMLLLIPNIDEDGESLASVWIDILDEARYHGVHWALLRVFIDLIREICNGGIARTDIPTPAAERRSWQFANEVRNSLLGSRAQQRTITSG